MEAREVERREKELESTVKRPAEAQKYQAQMEAEAAAYQKELEAKGRAAGVKLEGAARAEALKAQGSAEAAVMHEKAKAYREYNDAAVAEMVVRQLPELARAVSEPLSKVDKIVLVGENAGAPKITGQVAGVLSQLPPVIENLTGLKLQDLVQKLKPADEKK